MWRLGTCSYLWTAVQDQLPPDLAPVICVPLYSLCPSERLPSVPTVEWVEQAPPDIAWQSLIASSRNVRIAALTALLVMTLTTHYERVPFGKNAKHGCHPRRPSYFCVVSSKI